MRSSNKEKAVFRYLLTKSIEGQITPAEIEQLNILWATYPDLEKYYFDNVLLLYLLPEVRIAAESDLDSNSMLSDELWEALSEYERKAPKVQLQKQEPERELIQKVVYPPREKRRLNRFSIFILLNAAAVVLFFIYLRYIPPKAGVEVATLVDSVNAKWVDPGFSIQNGNRFVADSKRFTLQEGLIELEFDTQVRVVIEAPSEFQILDKDKIALSYGRLYSTVSHEAIGFSIYTQNARIVDLGTEFGVQADSSGETELHVFKGKVQLSPQVGKRTSEAITVSVGQAKLVDNEGHVRAISEKLEKFVRTIKNRYSIIADFQGRVDDILPSGWNLIDNNGEAPGPHYTNLANSGPLGPGDTCARIGLADGSLQNGVNNTPGGWIQWLKTYDSQIGFYGSFDFYMESTSVGPDAQFLFGDLSENNRNYILVSMSGTTLRYLHKMYTVVNEQRESFGKPKVLSDLMPKVWYRFCFRYVPTQSGAGDFSYKVTNLEGNKTYLAMESKTITLPDMVSFGFGTHNDMVRFDNIKIIPLSE